MDENRMCIVCCVLQYLVSPCAERLPTELFQRAQSSVFVCVRVCVHAFSAFVILS